MTRPWLILTLALTLATGLTFYVLPNLDLDVARLFNDSHSGFYVSQTWWGRLGRSIGADMPFFVLGGMILAYLAKRQGRNVTYAPSLKSLIFVSVSMILASGVLVNLVMKDHLHRPRPSYVSDFGGKWKFREFYQWDGECARNCSFPSGEASAAFWLVAPASLVPAPYKPLAIGAALVFGAITSLLRLAFGGHFLSDVLFGGLLTILVIFGVYRAVFGKDPP